MTGDALRVVPFGDAALLVDVAGADLPERARRSRGLSAVLELELDPASGWQRPVPGIGGVLIPFDPLRIDARRARRAVERLVRRDVPPDASPEAGRIHEIGVRYGGADGPDLDAVARSLGIGAAAVVGLHAGRDYEVLVLGFLPGFAYLGPLPAPLASLPRRAAPRPRVERGSVALAAGMTAVYPSASAGGWHLLGRTEATLWQPERQPPNALAPGDRVRFVPLGIAG